MKHIVDPVHEVGPFAPKENSKMKTLTQHRRDTGIGTTIRINTSPYNANNNLYTVLVDGEEFCYTENDDDGFTLQVSINTMYLKRGILEYC